MNYMEKVEHLHKGMMATLERVPNKETTPVLNGANTTITKEEFLYITGWSENRYISRSLKDKKDAALKHGFILNKSEGRGKNARLHITLTANFFRFWLIKEDFLKAEKEKKDIHEFVYSEVAEQYVSDVFKKKGFLDLGGAPLLAILDEYADLYSRTFEDTTHSAAKNKVSRVRAIMNEKGYLCRGKKLAFKQKRVIKKGETTYLQGPEAIRLDKQIEMSYAAHSKEMEETIPFRPEDTKQVIFQKMELRRERRIEHTEFLKERYGLEKIYNNYGSTLSERAVQELDNVIALFSAGATLKDIDGFLKQTFIYYQEDKQEQETEEEIYARAMSGDLVAQQFVLDRETKRRAAYFKSEGLILDDETPEYH
ncbi:hypothetical protein ACN6A9_01260 [Bacillus safensis]